MKKLIFYFEETHTLSNEKISSKKNMRESHTRNILICKMFDIHSS